jgi:translation initiation factor IF-2
MAVKRLRQVAAEFNLGTSTIVEFLSKKGIEVESSPNTKLSPEAYALLEGEFAASKSLKEASSELAKERKPRKNVTIEATISTSNDSEMSVEVKTKVEEKAAKEKQEEEPVEKVADKVASDGPKILGKLDLEPKKKAEPVVKEEAKVEETAPQEAVEAEVKEDQASTDKTLEVKEEKAAEKQEPEPIKEEVKEEIKEEKAPATEEAKEESKGPKVLGKLDNDKLTATNRPVRKPKANAVDKKAQEAKEKAALKEEASKKAVEETPKVETKEEAPKVETSKPEVKEDKKDFIETEYENLSGPKVLGKMVLPAEKKPAKKKPVGSSNDNTVSKRKRKRKRIQPEGNSQQGGGQGGQGGNRRDNDNRKNQNKRNKKKPVPRQEISEEDIQKQIKETLARLSDKKKSTSVKHRRMKRDKAVAEHQEEIQRQEQEKKVLKVTEFVSASDLANMMDVNVNQIIATCMSLGMFVSINQRLDAETLVIVAEEFGYEVNFVDAEVMSEEIDGDGEDDMEDTVDRSPIVTVMGHVDHGKTSLLDYIRQANVIAGEAGGITQHIGAYEVELENKKKITFLDTPGHEAFTAMRARGTKVTDIAVIVVAADDNIMPQTKEAINHAQAAGVPIIFAINKIDKPGANPDKIKEQLSQMNLLVEDWGGKIQSQDISAKHGTNVDDLMEKILLEAEMLELKSNPEKMARGAVLEAFLDKGKGYVANILVANGTLEIGDTVLAGTTWGKVKAMFNERNKRIKKAGPSQPALVLGLNSAPLAGDSFRQMKDEHEAKSIANKREQLQREQSVHTKKHITLDEIGRRLAIGDFKELNIIVKGDVDGSVEALSDSLSKLSTEEIQVNIIHKSVGQINEADVILASASDAIIIGFQVRPSLAARKMAEKEQTDIRLYSVIYKAIEEIKAAMQGMLSPDIVEEIVCNIEVRETFKITKVGTIAGCYVLDGKINRKDKVRVIRDGIVIYTGLLGSLKRFKDDVKEVTKGFECGLNIENFNDIKVGDIVEGYQEKEVQRDL